MGNLPYEILLLPKKHTLKLGEIDDQQKIELADILKRLLVKYDNLFETSFPYSMGWHGAPNGDGDFQHWQLHAHYYPPCYVRLLLRNFWLAMKLLSEAQRDLTPEQAAERLKDYRKYIISRIKFWLNRRIYVIINHRWSRIYRQRDS